MKKRLRKEVLGIRNSMSKDEVIRLSSDVIKQIKAHFNLDKYQVFGFYMPLGNEVDLRPLISELLSQGKTIVIPKVLNQYEMEFFPIKDLDDCFVSRFNLLEPKSNKKMPKNEIQIMFIPGISFSSKNYRLGFGAGYYDRYLVNYQGIKVGICFQFQLREFPINDYDIPVDVVITENRLPQRHNRD